MKTLAVLLFTAACGVETSTPVPAPAPVASGTSVCLLPQTGGFGSVCDGFTPHSQAWTWVEASPTTETANDGGEIAHRCNEVICPSGAACIVQNATSNGTELLMGSCQ